MIFYPKYNLWSDFQESNIFSNLYFFLKLYKTKFLLTNNVYLITQCNQLSFKRWCLLKKVNLGYQTDKYDIFKVRKGSLFAKKNSQKYAHNKWEKSQGWQVWYRSNNFSTVFQMSTNFVMAQFWVGIEYIAHLRDFKIVCQKCNPRYVTSISFQCLRKQKKSCLYQF